MPKINAPVYRVPDDVIEVADVEAVRRLGAEILDSARDYPIVLLTTRVGTSRPSLGADDVRGVVGPTVPIYLMATGSLTRELKECLPPKMGAFNGAARIWWPGVDASSDPHDHPLIHDRYQVYGSQALNAFERAIRGGPPPVLRQIKNQHVAMLERKCDRLERELTAERQRADQNHDASDRERELRIVAERNLRDERRNASRPATSQPCPCPSLEHDPDHAFHQALRTAWLESTTADDRRRYPVRAYRLHPEFLDTLRNVSEIPFERVAWVCAMVASKRAQELEGLAVKRLRVGSGGNDRHRVRADGARAMRCALKQMTPSAPRLHFWRCDDGMVEFASVCHHDDFEIPE